MSENRESFLTITRKRTMEFGETFSSKRQRTKLFFQNIIENIVEILKIRHVDVILERVKNASNLGQKSCKVLIGENCEELIGQYGMKITFTNFMSYLTDSDELLKGFGIKIEKIISANNKNVFGGTILPIYVVYIIWDDYLEELKQIKKYNIKEKFEVIDIVDNFKSCAPTVHKDSASNNSTNIVKNSFIYNTDECTIFPELVDTAVIEREKVYACSSTN